jgi:large subunit ribosomal protein L25
MPDTSTLSITRRPTLRKHSRNLRATGTIPAVIYGHRVEPVSVSLPRRDFERAFHRVGRSQLLDLQLEDESKPRKVLVREVQYDPRHNVPLHVDFYQVNLKEKINSEVPIVLVGESPAVQRREGQILQVLHSLKLSSLPADIPEHIEVDVTTLEAVDDAIHVGQLAVPENVEVLSTPDELVVKLTQVREASAEDEAADQETATAAAEASEAAAEPAAAEPAES